MYTTYLLLRGTFDQHLLLSISRCMLVVNVWSSLFTDCFFVQMVRLIVEEALMKYSADRTGLPDYALESAGTLPTLLTEHVTLFTSIRHCLDL